MQVLLRIVKIVQHQGDPAGQPSRNGLLWMDPARSSCTEGVVGMETGLTVNPSARQCVGEGLDKEYPGLCREAAVLATSNHLCLVLAKQH